MRRTGACKEKLRLTAVLKTAGADAGEVLLVSKQYIAVPVSERQLCPMRFDLGCVIGEATLPVPFSPLFLLPQPLSARIFRDNLPEA